jgi:Ca-activated chloride channel family protein
MVSSTLVFCHAAHAETVGKKISKAESSYNDQKYDEALQHFLDAQVELPENTALKFNVGNAYYRMANYTEAEKAYWGVATSGDPLFEEKAFYNLGNCTYKEGKLEEAVTHYQRALELDPKDEDARANLQFVREEIKRRINESKKREEEQKKNSSPQGKTCPTPSPGQTSEQGKESREPKEEKQGEQSSMQGETPQEAGQQQTDQRQKQREGDAQTRKMEQGQAMPLEEAERWLNTLSEEQKDLLKRQAQRAIGRRVQPDKDW